MQLQLPQFDAKQVNGAILTFNGVKTLNEELSKYTSQQLLEKYPAIPSSRADILPAGGLILEELMNYFQLENIRVSTYGLRYGIMIRAFEKSADKTSDEWLVITE